MRCKKTKPINPTIFFIYMFLLSITLVPYINPLHTPSRRGHCESREYALEYVRHGIHLFVPSSRDLFNGSLPTNGRTP